MNPQSLSFWPLESRVPAALESGGISCGQYRHMKRFAVNVVVNVVMRYEQLTRPTAAWSAARPGTGQQAVHSCGGAETGLDSGRSMVRTQVSTPIRRADRGLHRAGPHGSPIGGGRSSQSQIQWYGDRGVVICDH